MKTLVTMNNKETQLLEDTLNYIVTEDDRERNDFESQALDNGITPDELFDEHNNLFTEKVPKALQNHIFYKASVLLQALLPETYGG